MIRDLLRGQYFISSWSHLRGAPHRTYTSAFAIENLVAEQGIG